MLNFFQTSKVNNFSIFNYKLSELKLFILDFGWNVEPSDFIMMFIIVLFFQIQHLIRRLDSIVVCVPIFRYQILLRLYIKEIIFVKHIRRN